LLDLQFLFVLLITLVLIKFHYKMRNPW